MSFHNLTGSNLPFKSPISILSRWKLKVIGFTKYVSEGEYMDKSKIEQSDNNIKEDLEIKKFYAIQLESGAFISGMLVAKNEQIINEEVKKSYRIVFGNAKHIDLYEDEILSINLIQPGQDREEYFAEFELEHNVQCLDDKDQMLNNDVILGNIIYRKEMWDSLTESEKKEFISQLQLCPEEIVDLINILVDYKNENKKLYVKREKMQNAALDFMNKYEVVKETFPSLTKAIEFLYKESGIEKIIMAI